jgi:16S rRNA (adenine1518-N6/adenine1519-N6)-dimethyltransferase
MADRIDVRSLLRKHGLRAKRSWSQSFLVDRDVLEQIGAAAELDAGQPVVELGAGLGALTAVLARESGRVVAVERDRDLAGVLRSEFAGDPGVEVLEANAARMDWASLVERLGRPPVVVGNLPYHMASQILFDLLDAGARLDRWLLMVQREMAVRMAAGPGSRDYGVLSVQLQLRAEVEPVLDVPPEAFMPRPRVQSRVVRCRPLPRPRVAVQRPELLKRLVRGVFSQRRKTIRNGLKASFGRDLDAAALDAALAAGGIAPELRPEDLSLERFAALADALAARLEQVDGGGHQ